jgi:hypothetical protein
METSVLYCMYVHTVIHERGSILCPGYMTGQCKGSHYAAWDDS